MDIVKLSGGNFAEENGRLKFVAWGALRSPGHNLLLKRKYFQVCYLLDVYARTKADDLIPALILEGDCFIRIRNEIKNYIQEIDNNMVEFPEDVKTILLDLLFQYYETPVLETKSDICKKLAHITYDEYECDDEIPEVRIAFIKALEEMINANEERHQD